MVEWGGNNNISSHEEMIEWKILAANWYIAIINTHSWKIAKSTPRYKVIP